VVLFGSQNLRNKGHANIKGFIVIDLVDLSVQKAWRQLGANMTAAQLGAVVLTLNECGELSLCHCLLAV